MKRAFFLAPYFVPRRRVGSMRPFRFVIHLREFGWQPTVLTIASPGDRLTEREAEMLSGIEVISLQSPFDRTVSAESALSSGNAGAASKPGSASGLLRAVDRQFPVDTWGPLFALRYGEILRELQRVQPHVIWATGDPWSALVTSGALAHRLSLPYVADFRDPWTLCRVRTDGKWGITRAIDRRFERKVIERASVVLFQARETEMAYRRTYSEQEPRTTTITNSFSNALMAGAELETRLAPSLEGKHLNVCFFGRFRAYSPASVVSDALVAARRADPEASQIIRIHSFGVLSRADEAYARERGVEEHFVARTSVPLEESAALLRRFDLLLLSTDVRRPEIIPAKLFEYLAARRPILSLSLNPEVSDILSSTGMGEHRNPADASSVAEVLLSCARAKRSSLPLPVRFAPNDDQIERYEARNTTRDLVNLFESLI